jgi:alkanesulfonate monooxygenase SsuD/methylene tetrahydromethanopterin reductase-like flavin-dependent oxidoreductase (luciferase family)
LSLEGADDAHAAGVDEWSIGERADRFEEFVEAVDSLLSGSSDVFSGRFYRSKGFGRGPFAVQQPRPPLVIAAHGPRTLRVAARFADTWNVMAGFGRRGEDLLSFIGECAERLGAEASAIGRDPSAIRRSLLVQDSGFEWWSSSEALRDFLGRIEEAGVGEAIFYYPPYGEAEAELAPARFLDLMEQVIGT